MPLPCRKHGPAYGAYMRPVHCPCQVCAGHGRDEIAVSEDELVRQLSFGGLFDVLMSCLASVCSCAGF